MISPQGFDPALFLGTPKDLVITNRNRGHLANRSEDGDDSNLPAIWPKLALMRVDPTPLILGCSRALFVRAAWACIRLPPIG